LKFNFFLFFLNETKLEFKMNFTLPSASKKAANAVISHPRKDKRNSEEDEEAYLDDEDGVQVTGTGKWREVMTKEQISNAKKVIKLFEGADDLSKIRVRFLAPIRVEPRSNGLLYIKFDWIGRRARVAQSYDAVIEGFPGDPIHITTILSKNISISTGNVYTVVKIEQTEKGYWIPKEVTKTKLRDKKNASQEEEEEESSEEIPVQKKKPKTTIDLLSSESDEEKQRKRRLSVPSVYVRVPSNSAISEDQSASIQPPPIIQPQEKETESSLNNIIEAGAKRVKDELRKYLQEKIRTRALEDLLKEAENPDSDFMDSIKKRTRESFE
jgi:hypothetical protein